MKSFWLNVNLLFCKTYRQIKNIVLSLGVPNLKKNMQGMLMHGIKMLIYCDANLIEHFIV